PVQRVLEYRSDQEPISSMICRRGGLFCLPAGPFGALRADSASCGGHPVQRHQAPNVIGEVLQADLGARPHDADRAHDPAARGTLLRPEYMLDARADFALGAIRPRLRIRQRVVAASAPMNTAPKAASLELRLDLDRTIGAVGEHIGRRV